MEKEIYQFKIKLGLEDGGIELGSVIYAPNGRKGIVEEITSITFFNNFVIEVKGEASISTFS